MDLEPVKQKKRADVRVWGDGLRRLPAEAQESIIAMCDGLVEERVEQLRNAMVLSKKKLTAKKHFEFSKRAKNTVNMAIAMHRLGIDVSTVEAAIHLMPKVT